MNVGDCTIEESQTEDVDWVNNWKQYFHQFYVDDILIIPSWEEVKPEDKDKMIIHIDPGTAFGTGMHETTQLCIRQIRKYVTAGYKDTGCGVRKRNSGDAGSEIRRRLFGGNRSGSLCNRCHQREYGSKWNQSGPAMR